MAARQQETISGTSQYRTRNLIDSKPTLSCDDGKKLDASRWSEANGPLAARLESPGGVATDF
ncbi:hypothetical protein GRAN_3046 [Granulicella sibirica]|uniref:Uncharacterized protein n=1 Tax=Granulicella sibirica TaxID=2479048 RepID=A0A4Q0T2P4_9BACT|nr:hypothetical protein GRAN_3046 [Granulicella sibirica]